MAAAGRKGRSGTSLGMGQGSVMAGGLSRRKWNFAGMALAFVLAGCVSDQQRIDAIRAVNQAFCKEYEAVLAERGTKTLPVPRDEAFVAMRVAVAALGLHTEVQDASLGYLLVAGPSPLPLAGVEWTRAAALDEPQLHEIIQPYVGMAAGFVHFEPQGLDTEISATFLKKPAGTEISLTVRLREVSPPKSGWPRRECLGPNIVRAGLDKIWMAFEQELRAGPQRP